MGCVFFFSFVLILFILCFVFGDLKGWLDIIDCWVVWWYGCVVYGGRDGVEVFVYVVKVVLYLGVIFLF